LGGKNNEYLKQAAAKKQVVCVQTIRDRRNPRKCVRTLDHKKRRLILRISLKKPEGLKENRSRASHPQQENNPEILSRFQMGFRQGGRGKIFKQRQKPWGEKGREKSQPDAISLLGVRGGLSIL